jgi:hypothetical protein
VPDQTSGIDVMRRRMERASRQPPPPRRARASDDAPTSTPAGEETGPPPPAATAAEPAPPATAAPPRTVAATPSPRRRGRPDPVRLAADLPPANLAIRVRRPLDERLADLIHALRRDGVRTSKVEMIEMLLWELPEEDHQAVRERLRRFREWAPRGPGAPLGDPDSS